MSSFILNPNLPVIVGLTGTHDAGKGEIVKFFKQLNFKHFSAREDVLWPAVDADLRNLPRNRDSLNTVANEMRAVFGPSIVAFRLFELGQAWGQNSIIESIYTAGEIERIRAAANGQFFLLAVDADIQIRYKRARERGSETDNVTFEQFVVQQEREMFNADPNKHNLRACQELADAPVIMNNGTLNELHEQLRAICIRYLGFPALI